MIIEREKMIMEFLENSVYYPACSFDGTPIKFLGKMFSNFVYSDYLSEYDNLRMDIYANGLRGYKLINSGFVNAEVLFGIDWEIFIKNNKDIIDKLRFDFERPFARMYSFKRRIGYNEEHGKDEIEILYIKSEGISTYRHLYVKRNITPKCLVSIVPGLAFGGNFVEYPEMFIKLIRSTGKFPQYQFYDDGCADCFHDLLKYYLNVNEFNDNNRDYHWSRHFTLARLK